MARAVTSLERSMTYSFYRPMQSQMLAAQLTTAQAQAATVQSLPPIAKFSTCSEDIEK